MWCETSSLLSVSTRWVNILFLNVKSNGGSGSAAVTGQETWAVGGGHSDNLDPALVEGLFVVLVWLALRLGQGKTEPVHQGHLRDEGSAAGGMEVMLRETRGYHSQFLQRQPPPPSLCCRL